MSEGILTLLNQNNQSKYSTSTAIDQATKSSERYLPILQIMGGTSDAVKKGNVPIGVFALRIGKDKYLTLGREIVALLISFRPKAMIFKPDVISYYNPEHEGYQKVVAEADTKDSGMGFGLEFLVWLPEHQKLVCWFLGNKTGRNEADLIVSSINSGKRVFNFKIKLLENKKNSWHGFETEIYEPEITYPDPTMLVPILTKFNDPPEVETAEGEVDEATGTEDTRR